MMNFQYLDTYDEMSQAAKAIFDQEIRPCEAPWLILATGNSPLGLYRKLVSSQNNYQHLSVIKLDEWLGLPMDHPATCEFFLQQEVIRPLQIPSDKYISFSSQPADPQKECKRISDRVKALPSIELCILGLGKNGHLGLNEPNRALYPECHVVRLQKSTAEHAMLNQTKGKVTEGMTLGISEIFRAKKIILLVSGKGKERVFAELKKGQISSFLPASFLWLHPNVDVLVDREHLTVQ
ncbi:6-phosphogluconolactonase [Robiginitalea sp. IMCC44478]|uniref:6-phosphogluconolactonase n=1 Tax=Robiginitalea sp. IMCC44478 TaxID=3459122 RepID=UPI004041CAE8